MEFFPAELSGKCRCGAVRFALGNISCVWDGALICHCSMCPDKTYKKANTASEIFDPGMAFIAVSAPVFYKGITHNKNYVVIRTSTFAQRGHCRVCSQSLSIAYDCEENTVWVALDAIDDQKRVFDNLEKKAHIHCHNLEGKATPITAGDGIAAYDSWQPWLGDMDPCRPIGTDMPDICMDCFQLTVKCTCGRAKVVGRGVRLEVDPQPAQPSPYHSTAVTCIVRKLLIHRLRSHQVLKSG